MEQKCSAHSQATVENAHTMAETAGQLMAAYYVVHCELRSITLALLLTQADLEQTRWFINTHTVFVVVYSN